MSRLTLAEIEAGIAHLDHQFMTPTIWQSSGVDTWEDEEGTVHIEQRGKWYSMLSASGYMDRTEPMGPFETEEDAARELVEMYADDIDDCPDCAIPPCAASMGCLCAFHARDGAADEPCNATEANS